MNRIRITGPAARDIKSILAHSHSSFGDAAAERYQSLILRGLISVRGDPEGP